jgi:hypothetical protein
LLQTNPDKQQTHLYAKNRIATFTTGEATMKDSFNPIKGQRGEFRVALNLTELGDRAWEVLAQSREFGFHPPQFQAHIRDSGAVEIWAILLQQFHRYDAFTDPILSEWDEPIEHLHQSIGRDSHLSLIVLCNFREYLEPDAA